MNSTMQTLRKILNLEQPRIRVINCSEPINCPKASWQMPFLFSKIAKLGATGFKVGRRSFLAQAGLAPIEASTQPPSRLVGYHRGCEGCKGCRTWQYMNPQYESPSYSMPGAYPVSCSQRYQDCSRNLTSSLTILDHELKRGKESQSGYSYCKTDWEGQYPRPEIMLNEELINMASELEDGVVLVSLGPPPLPLPGSPSAMSENGSNISQVRSRWLRNSARVDEIRRYLQARGQRLTSVNGKTHSSQSPPVNQVNKPKVLTAESETKSSISYRWPGQSQLYGKTIPSNSIKFFPKEDISILDLPGPKYEQNMINPPNPRIEQVSPKRGWERSADSFYSSTDEDPPLSLLIDVQDYSDTLQRDLLSNSVESKDTPDMDILPPSPASNGLASSLNYIENWFDMSPAEQEQLRLAQANSDTDVRITTTENFGFQPLLDLVAWSDLEQGQTAAPSSSQEWSNESYSIFGATPPAYNRCRAEYFGERLKEVYASFGRDGSRERGSTHNQVA